MSQPATYLFAGGGSGGHLFPGAAVAEAILAATPDARVLFVGSGRDVERRICAQEGLPHVALPIAPLSELRRRPDRFLWGLCAAWRQARRLIRDERPTAVIGLGGLASLPLVWAASQLRVPVFLLEQNVIPGKATRWLARRAAQVCVAFAETVPLLPPGTRSVVTGNPVRRSIAALHSTSATIHDSLPPTLLILGGSQGAEGLNDAVVEFVRRRRTELSAWSIVHQTGVRQRAQIAAAYAEIGQPAEVVEFLSDMAAEYRRATLVVSRAGATTLAELACAGRPVVLTPYPYAADDHQRANAEVFAQHGAAVIVAQAPSAAETAARLETVVLPLLSDPARRAALGAAVHQLARPDAAAQILRLLRTETPPPD